MKFFHFGALAALGAAILAGCGGGSGGGLDAAAPTNPPATNNLSEPTGGNWKTFILSSGREVQVVAPPFSGSPPERAELDEIRALQTNRSAADNAAISYWNAGASVRWNEIARDTIIRQDTPPPPASRVYAALSVAQYDALVATYAAKYQYRRLSPAATDRRIVPLAPISGDPPYPSETAAVSQASAEVLSFLFPADAAIYETARRQAERSRLVAGVNFRSDLERGEEIGHYVAQKIIARLQNDRFDQEKNIPLTTRPTDSGHWQGTNPLLPGFGKVRPWLLRSGAQIQPPPPPAFGSPAFLNDLARVRAISDNRTPAQLAIADFWADAAKTFTPPGHWNLIATDLMGNYRQSELRVARTYALLNTAEMDAAISCWTTKFTYWAIRPTQADPEITAPIGVPNFPSYISGHSSFSGAASTVLGALYPADAAQLNQFAEEAGISRIYGGIHFFFDNQNGLETGRKIAALAIARGQSDGSPHVAPQRTSARTATSFKQTTLRALKGRGTKRNNPNWD